MLKRSFGPTQIRLPIIGQGTWNMELDPRSAAQDALRRGLDLGMSHIDTAELYGSGRVEAMVGEAIAGRRDEVYLVSKVLPYNASRTATVEACERSLRALGTDHLDLYLLHWPGAHPLEETFEAFEALRAAGKILAYGVSNFEATRLRRAVAVAGAGKIVCNQVCYHLEERAIEHEVLPTCEALDVALVAYSPFGSGKFPAPDTPGGETLQQIAEQTGASPHQVALAFLSRHPCSFVIPKAAQERHAEDNAGAGELQLSDAQITALDGAFPLKPYAGLPVI